MFAVIGGGGGAGCHQLPLSIKVYPSEQVENIPERRQTRWSSDIIRH